MHSATSTVAGVSCNNSMRLTSRQQQPFNKHHRLPHQALTLNTLHTTHSIRLLAACAGSLEHNRLAAPVLPSAQHTVLCYHTTTHTSAWLRVKSGLTLEPKPHRHDGCRVPALQLHTQYRYMSHSNTLWIAQLQDRQVKKSLAAPAAAPEATLQPPTKLTA